MRKNILAENEYYHIYNRGVDKRDIFLEDADYQRFLKSMRDFNCVDPIGSLYEKNLKEKKNGGLASTMEAKPPRLVEIVCFSLLPNHFHFIVKQLAQKGIEKIMQRIGTGYTMYFNKKYDRSGSLFQGTFKSSHIKTTHHLLYLSVYVNCNSEVHGIADSKEYRWSSFRNFSKNGENDVFDGRVITSHFEGKESYEKFAKRNIEVMKQKKLDEKVVLE